jgi:hypothetical protein
MKRRKEQFVSKSDFTKLLNDLDVDSESIDRLLLIFEARPYFDCKYQDSEWQERLLFSCFLELNGYIIFNFVNCYLVFRAFCEHLLTGEKSLYLWKEDFPNADPCILNEFTPAAKNKDLLEKRTCYMVADMILNLGGSRYYVAIGNNKTTPYISHRLPHDGEVDIMFYDNFNNIVYVIEIKNMQLSSTYGKGDYNKIKNNVLDKISQISKRHDWLSSSPQGRQTIQNLFKTRTLPVCFDVSTIVLTVYPNSYSYDDTFKNVFPFPVYSLKEFKSRLISNDF